MPSGNGLWEFTGRKNQMLNVADLISSFLIGEENLKNKKVQCNLVFFEKLDKTKKGKYY